MRHNCDSAGERCGSFLGQEASASQADVDGYAAMTSCTVIGGPSPEFARVKMHSHFQAISHGDLVVVAVAGCRDMSVCRWFMSPGSMAVVAICEFDFSFFPT